MLEAIVARARRGPAVICTAASEVAGQVWQVYECAFRRLGIRDVAHLDVARRDHADDPEAAALVAAAKLVFFSGGDQVRLTSRMAGSLTFDAVRQLYNAGGVVAGTSAGASALGETMPVSKPGHEHKVSAAFYLVPGLGLFRNVIVDQHFGQRGRMVRLIGAVAENPRLLGIGIDEDTAVVLNDDSEFQVVGSGSVYVVDGRSVTHSNVNVLNEDRSVSAFDLRVHVLSSGDWFDVAAQRPFLLNIQAPRTR